MYVGWEVGIGNREFKRAINNFKTKNACDVIHGASSAVNMYAKHL